jgi:hypothetical protein
MSDELKMEAAISRALEARREVAVPLDFAARVRASLPAPVPVRPRVGVGRTAAVVGAAVLLVVLFLLAPHAQASFGNVVFDVELLLLAQVGGIAYWLGVRREV